MEALLARRTREAPTTDLCATSSRAFHFVILFFAFPDTLSSTAGKRVDKG